MNTVLNLDVFLRQSSTTNLKTKGLYPEDIFGLEVKVSFGMGSPTHIPWISILGEGISTSNGYYPVYLYYKKENRLILAYGISEIHPFENPWSDEIINQNKKISEILDKPFRYGNSYVYKHYTPEITDEGVKYFSDGREVTKDEIMKDLELIISEYKKCLKIEINDENSDINQSRFYMEKHLEEFIIQNWDKTKFGEKYELIKKDGEIISQQYKTKTVGNIDILVKEKETGDYVVIELKRNQTSDETVGQVARYMGWVKENLNNENVKGIIVASKYDEKLKYALKTIPNIEIFLYKIDFDLIEHKR